jgi:Reverse transcriptase (RNA-dependent DNA polymerase)
MLSCLSPQVLFTSIFSDYQSAYRLGHSMESGLLKVINDVILAAGIKQTTFLLSLDISTAFDTIDFSILFERASIDFGICVVTLDWLKSFITDRLQYVGVGPHRSASHSCLFGVPQGSVLGPLLFAMYVLPIGNVMAAH